MSMTNDLSLGTTSSKLLYGGNAVKVLVKVPESKTDDIFWVSSSDI